MKRYFSLEELVSGEAVADRSKWKCPVATTGFFDGLHRGHQKLLAELRQWSRELGGKTIVITFDPHPRQALGGSSPPAILSTRHKLLLLERENIDATLVLPFDKAMSQWSVEKFVQKVFHDALGCHHFLLGFDSTIGHKRRGDFEYLSSHAEELEISVRQSEPLLVDETRISSTLVRDAILRGQLDSVRKITNRYYSILGRVVAGDGRGKSLGFPTANLEVEVGAAPPNGVYFAHVQRVLTASGEESPVHDCPALVNVGRRPTFTSTSTRPEEPHSAFNPERDRIEAHLLDYSGDLYGAWLEIQFLAIHRPEKRFDHVEDLVEQIRLDEQAFREFLTRTR